MRKLKAYAGLAALVIAIPGLSAQPRTTNLGTLTCTTGETAPQAAADATLSCSFKGEAGLEGDFTGRITRAGPADIPPGKRVLVWSVLSERPKVDLAGIEGQYRGVTGGTQPGVLVGGVGGAILLQPMTSTAQPGAPPAPALLELRLTPTRA
jgi:hypothetical protein